MDSTQPPYISLITKRLNFDQTGRYHYLYRVYENDLTGSFLEKILFNTCSVANHFGRSWKIIEAFLTAFTQADNKIEMQHEREWEGRLRE